MALGVVDLLEVIQIEHKATPSVQLAMSELGEITPVEASGQRIADGQLLELLFLQVLRGDVLGVPQHVGGSASVSRTLW